MKILLDLDDTVLINGGIHKGVYELIDKHQVILFSASPDIKNWANYFKIPYISKEDNVIADGDVLIDDTKEFFHPQITNAKYYFKTIDEFLTTQFI